MQKNRSNELFKPEQHKQKLQQYSQNALVAAAMDGVAVAVVMVVVGTKHNQYTNSKLPAIDIFLVNSRLIIIAFKVKT